jgi:glucose-1-phosphate cytidylyltransferase
MVDHFMASGKVAAFLCVQTDSKFPCRVAGKGTMSPLSSTCPAPGSTSTAATIFRKEIFNYIRAGEELVEEPYHRLVQEGLLAGYRHDGFWLPMDTFKDKQLLEDLYARGVAPWEVWKNAADPFPKRAVTFGHELRAHHEPVS